MTNAEKNESTAIADWAHGLSLSDVPPRVIDEAKHQILNIIAAIHAGHFSEVGRMASRPIKGWAAGKDATLIPSGEKTTLHYAIFGNAALSMSLTYDDYLLGAQAGAASVVVALALGEKLGRAGKDILVAQIIANEVAGRIGLATTRDALADQRSPVAHRLGATMAAAKLYQLDAEQTRNAIGLAMQGPASGVRAGFITSDARVIGAATAAPAGVQIAELAANGLNGGGEAIGGEHGYCSLSGRAQTAAAYRSLGEIWLTETLCYAPFPCARHTAGAVDCVLALQRQHNIDARKIEKIDVQVSPEALEIDREAQAYLAGPETNPNVLPYSLSYAVAVTLIDKELSPRQLTRDRVRDAAVWDLASRVAVGNSAGENAERSLVRQLDRMAENGFDLGRIDMRGVRANLVTKVRVQMKNDRSFEVEREAPPGSGVGMFDDRVRTVEDKFRRETRYSLRKENMEKAIDLVHHLDRASPANVKEVMRSICSER